MSDPIYDQHLLNQYLLGLLPEVETERFDELSIADDQFAARLQAAENDLVDAFVGNQLPKEMLEPFRKHYLASTVRREKVKFAMALYEANEAPARQVPPIRHETPAGNWLSRAFAIPRFKFGFAVAALVLLVITSWLVIDNLRLRRQMTDAHARQAELAQREQQLRAQIETQRNAAEQTEQELAQLRAEQQSQLERQKPSEASLIATLFLTPQLRDGGQPPNLRIQPTTKSVSAHLTLEPNDFSSYRVVLIDRTTQQAIWTSGPVRPRAKGDSQALTIVFGAELIKRQNYSLRVLGVNANGNTELLSDYPFKVVKH
jgi:hypothetical protein